MLLVLPSNSLTVTADRLIDSLTLLRLRASVGYVTLFFVYYLAGERYPVVAGIGQIMISADCCFSFKLLVLL